MKSCENIVSFGTFNIIFDINYKQVKYTFWVSSDKKSFELIFDNVNKKVKFSYGNDTWMYMIDTGELCGRLCAECHNIFNINELTEVDDMGFSMFLCDYCHKLLGFI